MAVHRITIAGIGALLLCALIGCESEIRSSLPPSSAGKNLAESPVATAPEKPEPPAPEEMPKADGPYIIEGINRPPLVPGQLAELAPHAKVVGVIVDGKPRAYLLSALTPMMRHVVNDMIEEAPVTVSYCDRTGCVCVITDNSAGEPLNIDYSGYSGGLLLRAGDSLYYQDSLKPVESETPFPFDILPHEVMTWSQWQKTYPTTDVYTGKPFNAPTGAVFMPDDIAAANVGPVLCHG